MIAILAALVIAHQCTITPDKIEACDFTHLTGKPPKGYMEIPAEAIKCRLNDPNVTVTNYGSEMGEIRLESVDDIATISNCGGTIGHVWLKTHPNSHWIW